MLLLLSCCLIFIQLDNGGTKGYFLHISPSSAYFIHLTRMQYILLGHFFFFSVWAGQGGE